MIFIHRAVLLVLIVLPAVVTRFLLARRAALFVRLIWTLLVVCPLPVFAWWMTFNSLGSGWGFALIAMFLTVAIGLGTIVGLLWHAFSTRAPK
ncbi:hypothetical protein IP81_07820 [Novosphingobium sp. AAP83]|nr:hypothetical protein IP81_07820 [Novosphingobium sp. AAP83]